MPPQHLGSLVITVARWPILGMALLNLVGCSEATEVLAPELGEAWIELEGLPGVSEASSVEASAFGNPESVGTRIVVCFGSEGCSSSDTRLVVEVSGTGMPGQTGTFPVGEWQPYGLPEKWPPVRPRERFAYLEIGPHADMAIAVEPSALHLSSTAHPNAVRGTLVLTLERTTRPTSASPSPLKYSGDLISLHGQFYAPITETNWSP